MKQIAFTLALLASPLAAQEDYTNAPCGGDWDTFKQDLIAEAIAEHGINRTRAQEFFAGVQQDPAVLEAYRRQGVFQRSFIDFSNRLIAQYRIDNGKYYALTLNDLFDRIEAEFGVPRGVLIAFWAFETDFGAVQGDFNTADALITLAHDCRRPALFREHVFAALQLYEMGMLDPVTTTGAWAGEIGQVQMLPKDIIDHGTDGDGDGRVDLKGSSADALTSGAAVLSSLGWRPNEPWLQEVRVPDQMDWSLSGLGKPRPVSDWQRLGIAPRRDQTLPEDQSASLLLPMGRNGPAFLAYPNFDVFFEWNQSFVYVLTAAYFATILEGAPRFDAGTPDPGLTGDEIITLQTRLDEMGYDVGGIDGIIGSRTRDAVQAEQFRLGLPADAWPTPDLLTALTK